MFCYLAFFLNFLLSPHLNTTIPHAHVSQEMIKSRENFVEEIMRVCGNVVLFVIIVRVGIFLYSALITFCTINDDSAFLVVDGLNEYG